MTIGSDYTFRNRHGNTILSKAELKGLKLGHISTMKELDEFEALNILEATKFLKSSNEKDFLCIDFARKVHIKMFSKVWSWAGKFRTTEKNIGIESFKVQTELYKHLSTAQFWFENSPMSINEMGARFHHKLVFIHPFSNGNGRWSRLYTEYFYERLSFEPPNWHPELDPKTRRKMYIAALQSADNRKYESLERFMNNDYLV